MQQNENLVILGTRGSDLALFQANFIRDQLLAKNPNLKIEILIIRTQGDQKQEVSFQQIGAQGIFTKEIEESLLSGKIDLAVHSLKDLSTDSPQGLKLGAIPKRAAENDLLILREEACLENIEKRKYPWIFREGSSIGTSAIRRSSLLKHYRPDVKIAPIRGNVPTRLQKLADKECDGILLAQAGVDRLKLDLSPYEVCALNPKYFPPSPGQGALAIQIRENDERIGSLVSSIHHAETAELIQTERTFLKLFDGGCTLPLGAFARRDEKGLTLFGFLDRDQKKIFDRHEGKSPEEVANALHQKFLTQLA